MKYPAGYIAGQVVKNDRFVREELVSLIVRKLSAQNSLGTNNSKVRTSKDVLLLIVEAHAEGQQLTVSDIHLTLNISRSTAGRAIRTLEDCGAVVRSNDHLDKRRQNLKLTEVSVNVVNQFLRLHNIEPIIYTAGSAEPMTSAEDNAFIDHEDEVNGLTKTSDIDLTTRLLMYQHGSRVSGVGHVVWDPEEDRCLFASREAAQMFGLSVESFLTAGASTNGFIDLLHPVDRGKIRRFIERFRTGHSVHEITYHLVDESGETGRYLLHALDRLPYPDASRVLELHILRDITQQITGVISLNQAREEAERTSKLRGDFISHFSHELRTPLNAIIGFSQMLESEVFGRHTSDKYLEYSKDIYNSGLHLLDIVNDVLDLSKLEAGHMQIESTPFAVEKSSAAVPA